MNSIYLEGELNSMRMEEYLAKAEEERQIHKFTKLKNRVTRKGLNLQRLQIALQKLGIF